MATRPQHPRDLEQRRAVVEPVERLRDRDDVGALRRKRDRLRSSLERRRLGNRRAELVEHLGERLDRRHPVTEIDERPRQLARAGAEIDDVARLLTCEPAHGVHGIAGARALVHIGNGAERGCPLASLIRPGAHASRLVIRSLRAAPATPRPAAT